ncbi:MAG TPA: ATP-binding protein, partial [Anaerolineae bacterium]|nr:ATP-binding protein [Anaerolineae bacterium]
DDWEQLISQAQIEWEQRTTLGVQQGKQYALHNLITAFQLDAKATNALLITLAPEIDLRYEQLFSFLQDDVTRKRPTVNLILNLLTDSFTHKLWLRRLFDQASPLIRHGLLECYSEQAQQQPLLAQFVRPLARVTAHLLGQYGVDQALADSTQLYRGPFELEDVYFSAEFQTFLQRNTQHNPLIALQGGYGVGKWSVAQIVAEITDCNLMRVNIATLKESSSGLSKGLNLLLRDARLNHAVVYINGWDAILNDGKPPAPILHQLLDHPHGVITAGNVQWQPIERQNKRLILSIPLSTPPYRDRLAIWQRLTQNDSLDEGVELTSVATHFRLSAGQIADVVATARDAATARTQQMDTPVVIEQADLLAASRFHSNQRLSTVAVKINPRYNWDDIVLPADTLAQLHEAVAMVKQKPLVYGTWGFDRKLALGKGMNALFAGDPGTGKTMAAEIVANALGLDMYKIDLSMMVSKYIGETEKNISKVFDEAATSNAILFFDEADAIFGKRSEVKDSHDRHANIEVSYLLQRMETFDGVVILATNLRANIDEAFTRRLHFAVQFPFPNVADRERIWRVTFPAETPLADDIDFALLAKRFRLAGGNIRSIVLSAAFLAAEAGDRQVSMAHILYAARREHQKIGRLIDERLF